MREIKFRAWDTDEKYMRYMKPFCIEDRTDRFINMQFTGLLDKNGKEIYEGDIIKRGDSVYSVIFESGKFTTSGGFGWCGAVFYRGNQPMDWEIIGNIYENPELINNKE